MNDFVKGDYFDYLPLALLLLRIYYFIAIYCW